LLVEDEEGVRTFVKTALQRFGYTVIEAESAETALAALQTRHMPIHLLLTDVVLRGMPGPDLAVQIRRDRPDIRVLLMSGYADYGGAGLGTPLIGEEWLKKPFSAGTLLAKIRQVFGYDLA
jgi:two-component system cell cycle sensor histidine kinase/response regulator CckA